MSVKSNFPLPYDYYINELNLYSFSTKSGAKYIAYFIEINFFEVTKVYSFNCKHSVMPVFDFMISWFMKADFQKPPKHSESIWSF